jgi:hypothetical protein
MAEVTQPAAQQGRLLEILRLELASGHVNRTLHELARDLLRCQCRAIITPVDIVDRVGAKFRIDFEPLE